MFFGFIYVHIPVEARILLSALRSGHCGSEDFSCDNACQRLLVVALMLKALWIAHFFVSCIPAENRRQKKPCRRCVSVCVCVVLQDLILLPEVCGKKNPSNCISETVLPQWVCMGDCVSLYLSLSFLAMVFHFKDFCSSSLLQRLLFWTGMETVFLLLGNTWLRMLPPTVYRLLVTSRHKMETCEEGC